MALASLGITNQERFFEPMGASINYGRETWTDAQMVIDLCFQNALDANTKAHFDQMRSVLFAPDSDKKVQDKIMHGLEMSRRLESTYKPLEALAAEHEAIFLPSFKREAEFEGGEIDLRTLQTQWNKIPVPLPEVFFRVRDSETGEEKEMSLTELEAASVITGTFRVNEIDQSSHTVMGQVKTLIGGCSTIANNLPGSAEMIPVKPDEIIGMKVRDRGSGYDPQLLAFFDSEKADEDHTKGKYGEGSKMSLAHAVRNNVWVKVRSVFTDPADQSSFAWQVRPVEIESDETQAQVSIKGVFLEVEQTPDQTGTEIHLGLNEDLAKLVDPRDPNGMHDLLVSYHPDRFQYFSYDAESDGDGVLGIDQEKSGLQQFCYVDDLRVRLGTVGSLFRYNFLGADILAGRDRSFTDPDNTMEQVGNFWQTVDDVDLLAEFWARLFASNEKCLELDLFSSLEYIKLFFSKLGECRVAEAMRLDEAMPNIFVTQAGWDGDSEIRGLRDRNDVNLVIIGDNDMHHFFCYEAGREFLDKLTTAGFEVFRPEDFLQQDRICEGVEKDAAIYGEVKDMYEEMLIPIPQKDRPEILVINNSDNDNSVMLARNADSSPRIEFLVNSAVPNWKSILEGNLPRLAVEMLAVPTSRADKFSNSQGRLELAQRNIGLAQMDQCPEEIDHLMIPNTKDVKFLGVDFDAHERHFGSERLNRLVSGIMRYNQLLNEAEVSSIIVSINEALEIDVSRQNNAAAKFIRSLKNPSSKIYKTLLQTESGFGRIKPEVDADHKVVCVEAVLPTDDQWGEIELEEATDDERVLEFDGIYQFELSLDPNQVYRFYLTSRQEGHSYSAGGYLFRGQAYYSSGQPFDLIKSTSVGFCLAYPYPIEDFEIKSSEQHPKLRPAINSGVLDCKISSRYGERKWDESKRIWQDLFQNHLDAHPNARFSLLLSNETEDIEIDEAYYRAADYPDFEIVGVRITDQGKGYYPNAINILGNTTKDNPFTAGNYGEGQKMIAAMAIRHGLELEYSSTVETLAGWQYWKARATSKEKIIRGREEASQQVTFAIDVESTQNRSGSSTLLKLPPNPTSEQRALWNELTADFTYDEDLGRSKLQSYILSLRDPEHRSQNEIRDGMVRCLLDESDQHKVFDHGLEMQALDEAELLFGWSGVHLSKTRERNLVDKDQLEILLYSFMRRAFEPRLVPKIEEAIKLMVNGKLKAVPIELEALGRLEPEDQAFWQWRNVVLGATGKKFLLNSVDGGHLQLFDGLHLTERDVLRVPSRAFHFLTSFLPTIVNYNNDAEPVEVELPDKVHQELESMVAASAAIMCARLRQVQVDPKAFQYLRALIPTPLDELLTRAEAWCMGGNALEVAKSVKVVSSDVNFAGMADFFDGSLNINQSVLEQATGSAPDGLVHVIRHELAHLVTGLPDYHPGFIFMLGLMAGKYIDTEYLTDIPDDFMPAY